MKTFVFLLRVDSVNNAKEGEVYEATKGVVNCNVWASPKLIDHQVMIATGQKAIREVYDQYKDYNITKAEPIREHDDNVSKGSYT